MLSFWLLKKADVSQVSNYMHLNLLTVSYFSWDVDIPGKEYTVEYTVVWYKCNAPLSFLFIWIRWDTLSSPPLFDYEFKALVAELVLW